MHSFANSNRSKLERQSEGVKDIDSLQRIRACQERQAMILLTSSGNSFSTSWAITLISFFPSMSLFHSKLIPLRRSIFFNELLRGERFFFRLLSLQTPRAYSQIHILCRSRLQSTTTEGEMKGKINQESTYSFIHFNSSVLT